MKPHNHVQSPFNTQNFNRYSYVVNNPLKYTDPSGEFLSGIGAAVLGWVSTIGDATSNAVSSGVLVQGAMAAGQVFAMAGITYVSIYAGLTISTSSIPFANTFAIVASSFTSNIGMSTLNGNTSVVVSVGFASYDFDNGKANGIWNWNNLSPIEKIGYGLGALANLSDLTSAIDKFTRWEEKLAEKAKTYMDDWIEKNPDAVVDQNTVGKNAGRSYPSYFGINPKILGSKTDYMGMLDNWRWREYAGYLHDVEYINKFGVDVSGAKYLLSSWSTLGADIRLMARTFYLGLKHGNPFEILTGGMIGGLNIQKIPYGWVIGKP